MKNTHHRTGQMEIMGLIIIVILLTLAMFFVVSLKTSKVTPEIKKTFESEQLASNFIIAFLKTNTECNTYTIENLIQDCAVEQKLFCEGYNSCEYVNNTADLFINNTFKNWGKDYHFEIEGIDFGIKYNSTDTCNREMQGKLSFQPISLYPFPGTVIVNMYMCK